jgi:hypothetical protein
MGAHPACIRWGPYEGLLERFEGGLGQRSPQAGDLMKLTDTKVKNARAGDREIKLADGQGLYLLITPQGG